VGKRKGHLKNYFISEKIGFQDAVKHDDFVNSRFIEKPHKAEKRLCGGK